MLVTRRSLISGKEHTMDLPVTQAQIDELIKGPFKWTHPTMVIQKAFPNLTPDEREFLFTGITPNEWNGVFGEDE